jgi:hypothetical protein
VDRVVSNYRCYSHPINCNIPQCRLRRGAVRPWGCKALEHLKDPLSPDVRLFQHCFPSPGIEDMAQSVMSPWANTTHFANTTLSWTQQQKRLWLARQFIQGSYKILPSPHMRYNYDYYRN